MFEEDSYVGVSQHYLKVREFMLKAGQRCPEVPTELDEKTRILRARLILEEVLEKIRYGLGVNISIQSSLGKVRLLPEMIKDGKIEFSVGGLVQDLVEIIDGCCDISVVNSGTLIACGIRDIDFQQEVDENNLAKFGPGGYRDENGKWLKPKDHTPPKIKEMLEKLTADKT